MDCSRDRRGDNSEDVSGVGNERILLTRPRSQHTDDGHTREGIRWREYSAIVRRRESVQGWVAHTSQSGQHRPEDSVQVEKEVVDGHRANSIVQ